MGLKIYKQSNISHSVKKSRKSKKTNEPQLWVISEQSNRRILEALRDAFPSGLNAHGIVEKTGLSLKTVYAPLNEPNRELFVDELGKQRRIRGRPLVREVQVS